MSDILTNELVIAQRSDIVAIADAVRNKTGTVEEMGIDEIVSGINSISESVALDLDEEIEQQDDIIAQIQTALEGKTANTGIDTSDATAAADDIISGKTAYVNGEKITGTLVIQSYYISDVEPSTSLGSDGDLCLVRAGE